MKPVQTTAVFREHFSPLRAKATLRQVRSCPCCGDMSGRPTRDRDWFTCSSAVCPLQQGGGVWSEDGAVMLGSRVYNLTEIGDLRMLSQWAEKRDAT